MHLDAINFFFKSPVENFLKINTSCLCWEDLKCRAWCIFFYSIPLKYQMFQVQFSLFCCRNFMCTCIFVLCLKQRKQVLSLHSKCFLHIRILDTTIKIVNKSKLLVSKSLFSVNFLKSLYSVTVKSSKPRNLKPVMLAKTSIHKFENACRKWWYIYKCIMVMLLLTTLLPQTLCGMNEVRSNKKRGSDWNSGLKLKVMLCHGHFGWCWATL